MPSTETEPQEGGGYLEEEAPPTKPADSTPSSAVGGSAGMPKGKPKRPPSSAPRPTTLSEAEDTFEEEELRLAELLGGRAVALDSGSCGRVCDALASMRRSADAICDLAGDDDARCDRARDKLTGSEQRVASRGCRCP